MFETSPTLAMAPDRPTPVLRNDPPQEAREATRSAALPLDRERLHRLDQPGRRQLHQLAALFRRRQAGVGAHAAVGKRARKSAASRIGPVGAICGA